MKRKGSQSTSIRRFPDKYQYSIKLLFISLTILGLLAFIGTDLDPERIWELLSYIDYELVIMLLLLSCVNFIMRAQRWYWFARRLKLDISVHDSYVNYLAGFSMGVTPGRMGELIRLWMLRSYQGVNYHRSMPLLVADRVYDLLVIVVLVISAGIWIGTTSLMSVYLALALTIIALILLRFPRYFICVIDIIYGRIRRWKKLFAAMRRMLRTGREMFSLFNAILAVIFSIIAWLAECIAFYILLIAFNADITYAVVIFIYTFSTLVGVISFLPGGLGGFEIAAVVLLVARGIDIDTAVIVTSVIRLTTLWFSVALGSAILAYVLYNQRDSSYKE